MEFLYIPMEKLELNKQQQIANIITARYSRHAQTALDGYFKTFGLNKETIEEITRSWRIRISQQTTVAHPCVFIGNRTYIFDKIFPS